MESKVPSDLDKLIKIRPKCSGENILKPRNVLSFQFVYSLLDDTGHYRDKLFLFIKQPAVVLIPQMLCVDCSQRLKNFLLHR